MTHIILIDLHIPSAFNRHSNLLMSRCRRSTGRGPETEELASELRCLFSGIVCNCKTKYSTLIDEHGLFEIQSGPPARQCDRKFGSAL